MERVAGHAVAGGAASGPSQWPRPDGEHGSRKDWKIAAIRQEKDAVAGGAGVIDFPVYIGNISGAADAATMYMIGLKRTWGGSPFLLTALFKDYPAGSSWLSRQETPPQYRSGRPPRP
jgi:hypothetical protein